MRLYTQDKDIPQREYKINREGEIEILPNTLFAAKTKRVKRLKRIQLIETWIAIVLFVAVVLFAISSARTAYQHGYPEVKAVRTK